MGDRCYLTIRVRTKDVPRTREILGVDHEYDDPDTDAGDTVWLTNEQANYGLLEARQELAAAGVDFVGWHGEGGSYSPYVFIAFRGEHLEAPSLTDGHYPCVEISRDAEPIPEQLAQALRYHRLLDELEEAWSAQTAATPS